MNTVPWIVIFNWKEEKKKDIKKKDSVVLVLCLRFVICDLRFSCACSFSPTHPPTHQLATFDCSRSS